MCHLLAEAACRQRHGPCAMKSGAVCEAVKRRLASASKSESSMRLDTNYQEHALQVSFSGCVPDNSLWARRCLSWRPFPASDSNVTEPASSVQLVAHTCQHGDPCHRRRAEPWPSWCELIVVHKLPNSPHHLSAEPRSLPWTCRQPLSNAKIQELMQLSLLSPCLLPRGMLCMLMYVCMYVCMYVHMHACMYVCMHACAHVWVQETKSAGKHLARDRFWRAECQTPLTCP